MARKAKTTHKEAGAYVHDEATRKNNPEAGLIDVVAKAEPKNKNTTHCWDPRESPQLVWAGKAGLKRVEVDEQASIEIPLVNLHIHERVSTEAIIRTAKRQDAQRTLFADTDLGGGKDLQFYQHDVDWANRMILGDSLLVMNSLVEREGMRGKVQCIYMDPPYGIKFGSNFQPKIDQRDVKDGKDEDLTREVMQVQAFRDTWELGVHSYLTYLRDRLLLAKELLSESGSIFVQIGDENVHRVRCLMDEVFGEENFCAEIVFAKTSGFQSKLLTGVADYLLWYG
ncbi:MAG: DNA methyltransferase, partial [Fimbriimonadaceae bacterium]